MPQSLKLPQLNVVILCGRLVADPHPLTASGDRAGSAFTIAINRSLGRGKKAVSTFVDVTTWGDVAAACNQYLGKGSAVMVTGSLANYEKKREKGAPLKTLQVSAAQVQFLTPRPDQPEDEAPE
jgi:single-strand DNA-binding protein